MGGEAGDVFVGSLNGFNRRLAFGADGNVENAGMAEVAADAASSFVGESTLGANVIEQARGKSSSEGFVENADGVVVGIVARSAERDHADARLVHIIFGDDVVAGLGRGIFDVIFRRLFAARPRLESGA